MARYRQAGSISQDAWYIGAPTHVGKWRMAPSRSSFANVVPFPRPFRAAAAQDDGARASGNAALLAVAVVIVVGGVFLVDGITSIPRHVDCNFSKHRPCHSFVDAN
jgi:hypothetical protein